MLSGNFELVKFKGSMSLETNAFSIVSPSSDLLWFMFGWACVLPVRAKLMKCWLSMIKTCKVWGYEGKTVARGSMR